MKYKFVNRRDLSPATKNGEYKLNDIIEVEEDNGDKYYRIYLNNAPYYVKLPYNIILLSQLKEITWTKEPNTNVVKSYSNKEIYLSELLRKHGYEKYQLYDGKIEEL